MYVNVSTLFCVLMAPYLEVSLTVFSRLHKITGLRNKTNKLTNKGIQGIKVYAFALLLKSSRTSKTT